MAKRDGFKDYQAVVSCLLMGIIFFFTLKRPSLVLDMLKYVFGNFSFSVSFSVFEISSFEI